jgi:hypothetical protein
LPYLFAGGFAPSLCQGGTVGIFARQEHLQPMRHDDEVKARSRGQDWCEFDHGNSDLEVGTDSSTGQACIHARGRAQTWQRAINTTIRVEAKTRLSFGRQHLTASKNVSAAAVNAFCPPEPSLGRLVVSSISRSTPD